MKDLVLNFSWAKFLALQPTDMLALIVMCAVSLFVCLFVIGLVLYALSNIWLAIADGVKYIKDD